MSRQLIVGGIQDHTSINSIQDTFAGTLRAFLSVAAEQLISYPAYKLALAAHFSPVILCLVRDTMCVCMFVIRRLLYEN